MAGEASRSRGAWRFAQVALARALDQFYTYAIPAGVGGALRGGSLVEAPLKNDTAAGVVVDLLEHPGFKGKIKPLTRHLTPEYAIDASLIDLGRWIAEYYFCSLGEALATISMIGMNDVRARTRSVLCL